MKKISIILGSFVLTAISAMAATGQAPKPESCTVGDRPFTRPLDEIGFYFDGGIKTSRRRIGNGEMRWRNSGCLHTHGSE